MEGLSGISVNGIAVSRDRTFSAEFYIAEIPTQADRAGCSGIIDASLVALGRGLASGPKNCTEDWKTEFVCKIHNVTGMQNEDYRMDSRAV
jgi:hypothetical protein